MTNSTHGKLRLGPLPRTETVKLTITLSIELKASLDRYADLHAQAWSEPVDVLALVPHMLAAFMERDRGFKALRKGLKGDRAASRASAAPQALNAPARPDQPSGVASAQSEPPQRFG